MEDFYLQKLLALKNNFSVKIISGVRGVGKTALLKNFIEKLRTEGVAESEIVFIDCAASNRPKNFQELYKLVDDATFGLDKFYLLIDDVEFVADYEKAISAIFINMPAEIYVTCSSGVLAEKISALLPDELRLYPPSFAEYKRYFPTEDALENYLHFGGLPVTFGANKNSWQKLLRGTTYEIMFDLVAKNSIQRAETFRLLMKTLAQNVGEPISSGNLLEVLDCTAATLKSYLSYSTALFQKIPRFDIKAEKFLIGGEKIYCVDNGILCALAEEIDEDILIENAVYVALLRRGYAVSSGKFGAMNITFVAERNGKKIFIQVMPKSGVTVRKASRPLRAMPDVEKILITFKQEKNFGDVKNITLREFLFNA